MADATPLSFTKQISILDSEVTITVNDSVDANNIQSDGTIEDVVKLTQAEYDALTPIATTYYVIVG